MGKKISEEIIKQIPNLYNELGTYKAVAEHLGISASTVSKYIKLDTKMETSIKRLKISDKVIELPNIEDIKPITNWAESILLTDIEQTELRELQKNISYE